MLNKINKKIQIPKFRLWVIWLLIIVIPSIISVIGYNIFSKEYLYFAKTDLIYKSFDNIKRFDQAIIPEKFMSSKLPQISQISTENTPDILKKEIDSLLCGETMFCLFFDEKSEKIVTVQNNNLDTKTYKIPPLALLRNTIKKFNIANLSNNSKETNKKGQSLSIVLQQLFKTATTIPIKKDKISKNFSVSYGGELYFIYNLFAKPSNNYYGFFAVMQGRDFDFRKMLNEVHKTYPYARIVFKDMNPIKTTENPELFYSGLKETHGNIFITSPANEKFIRHVINGGTEFINPGYSHLLPFIEYQVPITNISTKIQSIYTKIRLIALFLILSSAIFCLNICFYGFSDSLSFKNKIIILALISSLFPFGVFFTGTYFFNKYEKLISKTSIIQYADTELQLASQELDQYITEIESEMTQGSIKLSEELSIKPANPSIIINSIEKTGKKLQLSSIMVYFKNIPEELKTIIDGKKLSKRFIENTSEELMNEDNESAVNIMIDIALQHVNDTKIEIESNRTRQDRTFIGNNKIYIPAINNTLQNDGKMLFLNQGTIPTWFLMKMISNINTNEIIAFLIAKLEPRPILNSFLTNSSLQKKGFKEIKDNYEINYSFLPVEKSGSAPVWSGSGNLTKDEIKQHIENPLSEHIEFNNKLVIKRYNQKIPHLAIATIKELNQDQEYSMIWVTLAAIILYLLLILYLSGKLFDLMFVIPVMSLASNAGAIARGSEEWNTEITSGDEFEELNNTFKNLVTNLKERNLLKSYVSEDAFIDIEESNNLNLLPGGEYKEATIVFSAIKNYDEIIAEISPQENIKLLSKYVSISENITKEFNGSLDKILGDTVMLVFRDEPGKESHGLRAAKAALALVSKAKEIGLPGLYTGIASGTVISGKIGSYSGKLDFTVIGNPVNLAARFKSEAKNGTEETGIIISGITMGLMNGLGRVKFLRRVSIKGKSRKYNIYELLSLR